MERIRENPTIALAGVIIIACCVVTGIWGIWSARTIETTTSPAPLSEIVLRSDELAIGYERDGISPDCQTFLTIPLSQDDLEENPIECYQVKFSTSDRSTIVLNAIWVFADSAKAESAFGRITEQTPIAGNLDTNIMDVPMTLGDRSIASTAKITESWSPLYVNNLYWRRGNAVIRLSIINHKNFISIEEILVPARTIDTRLASR